MLFVLSAGQSMVNNFQPQIHHRVQSNCLETLETSHYSKKNKVTLLPLLYADPRGFWQTWKGDRINELCGNRKQLGKCIDSPFLRQLHDPSGNKQWHHPADPLVHTCLQVHQKSFC